MTYPIIWVSMLFHNSKIALQLSEMTNQYVINLFDFTLFSV